ncbi:hypothetical protein J8F10_09045 [Gemmata sp. G18]|uniref:Sulfotransferase family protein n=1 Tax=Gemmata palustris TaxID=2822762 RepID=A0ABS5BNX5_9BACT|nr:hypothetical protein [Gemmata palustris]MBP3955426.1 hypothetical protein [Gemmata palustris]
MTPQLLPPVVVSGFGRCGSSLVMQMLHAAGFPVTGDYPSFECEEYGLGGEPPPAGASKVINPECNPPPGGPYRWIWLDRNHAQQAKSQAKLLRELAGIRLPRRDVRVLACSYAPARRDAFDVMRRLGGPVLVMSFEELVSDPCASAKRISDFVGCGQIEQMANVVKKRSADCLPYLLERELLQGAA